MLDLVIEFLISLLEVISVCALVNVSSIHAPFPDVEVNNLEWSMFELRMLKDRWLDHTEG
jgi:hypothetical protein